MAAATHPAFPSPIHAIAGRALRLLICCSLLFLPQCGPAEPEGTEIGAPVAEVLCANWVSHALLQSLLGDAVPVHCLLDPATSSTDAADQAEAESFQPSRDQLQRLQRARLVVLHGSHLEKWAERSNLAASRVVDGSRPLLGFLIMKEGKAHSHGPGGEHSHKLPNPYTWLSPQLLGKQADDLAARLKQAFPDHADAIEQAHKQLSAELSQLDQDFKTLGTAFAQVPANADGEAFTLPGSHPAFEYLSKRYGLQFQGADDPKVDLLLQPKAQSISARLRANLAYLQSLLP